MTPEQRFQRICELLAKACMLDWAETAASKAPVSSSYEFTKQACEPASELTDEERIVDYLRTGPASPKELSVLLGLSRRTLNRRMSDLIGSGRVVRKGQTKRTAYELT